jgi:hypothetical protein
MGSDLLPAGGRATSGASRQRALASLIWIKTDMSAHACSTLDAEDAGRRCRLDFGNAFREAAAAGFATLFPRRAVNLDRAASATIASRPSRI